MSDNKCKKCQKEIDSKATKCPFCQSDLRSWFRKHPILTGIIALVIVGIILPKGGDKTSSIPSSETANNQTDQKSSQETSEVAKIGDTVTDKDLAFTVTNVTTAKTLGNEFTRKESQGVFNIITIKIENKGKETITVDSSMLQITDSQNRKFDRSIDGQTAKGLAQGKVDLFLQQVQPGLSVTGDIVFDLPSDIQEPKLIVKGSLFSSGKVITLVK